MGPVDPSVRNPGKNTVNSFTYWLQFSSGVVCTYFTEHCPDPVSFYSGPLRKCSHTGQAYSLCRPAPLKALSI